MYLKHHFQMRMCGVFTEGLIIAAYTFTVLFALSRLLLLTIHAARCITLQRKLLQNLPEHQVKKRDFPKCKHPRLIWTTEASQSTPTICLLKMDAFSRTLLLGSHGVPLLLSKDKARNAGYCSGSGFKASRQAMQSAPHVLLMAAARINFQVSIKTMMKIVMAGQRAGRGR